MKQERGKEGGREGEEGNTTETIWPANPKIQAVLASHIAALTETHLRKQGWSIFLCLLPGPLHKLL